MCACVRIERKTNCFSLSCPQSGVSTLVVDDERDSPSPLRYYNTPLGGERPGKWWCLCHKDLCCWDGRGKLIAWAWWQGCWETVMRWKSSDSVSYHPYSGKMPRERYILSVWTEYTCSYMYICVHVWGEEKEVTNCAFPCLVLIQGCPH